MPSRAGARHPGARAGAPAHPLAERRRVGQRGRDHVARGDLHAAHRHRLGRVEAELVQRAQHADELLPQPVLERHPLALHPAGDQHDLLVLDVHALDRADALRELEHLRLGEGRRGVEAALALPDQRRVQALLDRRPDRERRREVIPLDHEVGAVAHPHLARPARRARRRRSARRRPTAPARRRSPPAPAGPACSHCSCARAGARRASPPAARRGAAGGALRASSPCPGTSPAPRTRRRRSAR